MTDPMERMTKALNAIEVEYHGLRAAQLSGTGPEPGSLSAFTAKRLLAQGFGHRDDILREFAEYLGFQTSLPIDEYLASLAAKEEER